MTRLVGVAVLAALLLADIVVIVGLVVGIVRSLTGSDAVDPHGYLRIFGLVALLVLVPIGLVLVGALRWAAGPLRTRRDADETSAH